MPFGIPYNSPGEGWSEPTALPGAIGSGRFNTPGATGQNAYGMPGSGRWNALGSSFGNVPLPPGQGSLFGRTLGSIGNAGRSIGGLAGWFLNRLGLGGQVNPQFAPPGAQVDDPMAPTSRENVDARARGVTARTMNPTAQFDPRAGMLANLASGRFAPPVPYDRSATHGTPNRVETGIPSWAMTAMANTRARNLR